MGKKNKQPMTKKKKIILIILAIIFAPIMIIILWALIYYCIYMPIAKYFDHQKMSMLDSQMQKLYSQIVAVKSDDDNWRYQAVCDNQRTGWANTGKYDCLTSISLEKTVTTAEELQALHEKYYSMIDTSDIIQEKNHLIVSPANKFGKKFVISNEEKNYEEDQTKVECTYILSLEPLVEDFNIDDYYTGSTIDSKGQATLTFQCYKLSLDQWYTKYNNIGQLIPNNN